MKEIKNNAFPRAASNSACKCLECMFLSCFSLFFMHIVTYARFRVYSCKSIACIMRSLFVALLFILPGLLMSQAVQNTSGNWNVATNWVGNNIGDDISEDADIGGITSTIVNGDDYTIASLDMNNSTLNINSGGKLTIGSLASPGDLNNPNNTATITVNGDLEIFGSLIAKNGLSLVVTGTLRIRGDFTAENNADINISGTLIVDGDLTAKNGSDWNVPGSVDIGGDLDVKNNTTVVVPVGTFTVGGSCSEGNTGATFCTTVLPITLVSFKADQEGRVVHIKWVSGTEIENDFYTVQKSENGLEYRDVADVKGAGDSNDPLEYSITDNSPVHGVSYYRLVQTDFDGTRSVFPPVRVDFSGINTSVVYPNPAHQGKTVKVYTGLTFGEQATLNVRDLQGRVIYSATVADSQVTLAMGSAYKSGVYIVELQNAVSRSLHRLVVE